MQKLLCKIGLHSYKTIECTDCFTTRWEDRPKWSPIKHMVWYQQCDCCGKRRMKDTHKKDTYGLSKRHNGMEHARVAWVTYGKVYLGDGQTVTPPAQPPKPTNKRPKLKVVDGGKNG